MSKALEEAKEVIKENYKDALCGIFNTHNIADDYMSTLYDNEELDLEILICYHWEYFEVFGLTNEEFVELEDYYYSLRETEEKEEEPNELKDAVLFLNKFKEKVPSSDLRDYNYVLSVIFNALDYAGHRVWDWLDD